MEVANICKERQICISKPREDGSYSLITPNHLLLRSSSNVLPDNTGLALDLPNHVTSMFWKIWASKVSPSLLHRPIWHKQGKNLCLGDLVMVSEASKGKAEYYHS